MIAHARKIMTTFEHEKTLMVKNCNIIRHMNINFHYCSDLYTILSQSGKVTVI
jgi:hypothetical protein